MSIPFLIIPTLPRDILVEFEKNKPPEGRAAPAAARW